MMGCFMVMMGCLQDLQQEHDSNILLPQVPRKDSRCPFPFSVSLQILSGIVPTNNGILSKRNCRNEISSPISDGIDPDNPVACKNKYSKLVNFPIEVGINPLSR